jgi:two-component system CheB/CheR fusion protein
MNNLLAGTGIGTVFVDPQPAHPALHPGVTRIINLIQSDIGRPVGHIVSNFIGYDRLLNDATEVLNTLVPREAQVQTTDGKWYTVSILPYRTLENVIEGAVITFVDITDMKRAEAALPALRKVALEQLLQLSRAEVLAPYLTERLTKGGAMIQVWITATALLDENGQQYAVATTERAQVTPLTNE